jgi:tRNA pseudouridine38-40 synthase
MHRYTITIEYDGGPFVGWQMQENGPSVQGALTEALVALSGERRVVAGAGRTDSGVHALGQVAHFDLAREFSPDSLRDGLNFHLKPAPIAVLAAERADPEFHARFDATSREYLYRIANRRAPLALERGKAWLVHQPLDTDAMHEAAQVLIGKHDFTTFRAAHCQSKSPVKTLDVLEVSRLGQDIEIRAQARSFLHHQVRSIAGTLHKVGVASWTAKDVKAALEAKDRARCGPVAPPDGLYLVRVSYDEK